MLYDYQPILGNRICIHTLVRVSILASCISAASGHTIEGFQPLDLQGFHAPFGFDQTETYTEVWGDNDLAFLGSLGSGVAIVDVSDPTAPWTMTEYGFDLGVGFHDVRTLGEVGFFSTREDGTHVVDLSDPFEPIQLSRVDAQDNGFDSVTNAAIYDDLLWQVSAGSSEIAVTNISNPALPEFVGRVDTQDSVGVYDLAIVDNRMYVAGLGGEKGEGATYVYDIAGFANEGARLLAQIPTGSNTASARPNRKHSKLIVTQREAGGGVSAWDISNLESPAIIDAADASDFGVNAFSAGSGIVLDQTAYIAWHQAGAQVLDLDLLDQSDTIFRTGGFATSQASPLEKFVGNTSVFPMSHDRVLLADSQWGLYVVDASNVVTTTATPPLDLEASCRGFAAGSISRGDLADVIGQLGILAGDADQNGAVEFADFLRLSRNFGQADVGYAGGDFDCSGNVEFPDFLILSSNFGVQSPASVPEPISNSLMAFGIFCVIILRTRGKA